MGDNKMKALHYDGPYKVSVKEIDIPDLQHPDDAIVKVTTAGESHPLTLSLLTHPFLLPIPPPYTRLHGRALAIHSFQSGLC